MLSVQDRGLVNMENDVVKTITSLLVLSAFIGILAMVLGNPKAAGAVLGAGTTTITGVTNALEGKPTGA